MNNPTKPTLKTEILPLFLAAISWGLSFYFYAHFPEKVASHWNFQGMVDGYSGKATGAFAIPALITGMYLMFLFIPFLDPKKDRYQDFAKVYHIFKNFFIGLFFILYCLTGAFNLGYPVNVGMLTPILIGILFVFIGNYLGKIKNNWFMGIRTPWTLSSENVWNKTHRLGGWLFVAFGFLLAVSPFLGKIWNISVFIGGITTVVLVPMIYSYVLYRQEQAKK